MRINRVIERCEVLKKLKRSSTANKCTGLYATAECTEFSMHFIRTKLIPSITCHMYVSHVNNARSLLQCTFFIYCTLGFQIRKIITSNASNPLVTEVAILLFSTHNSSLTTTIR
jgi:hypothetical protein